MRLDAIKCQQVLTDEACAIQVEGPFFFGTGWSKRHPKDKPDNYIGALLAYKRALEACVTDINERLERLNTPLPF